jgi:tripartite-type tricarboxylate transporter receptor subunit TctC
MNFASISRALVVTCVTGLFAFAVHAQQYPNRPIRILVGFGAGGGTDTVARVYAAKLQEVLKVGVVVENKPGAQELLAAQPTIQAAPDGYTLWLGTSAALAQAPAIRTDLPYDPLKNLTLIGKVGEVDAVLAVKNSLPVNSLPEFISYAKANPGKLNYASAGVGAGNHLLAEYIKLLTGVDLVHVPYKSDADVVRELAAGTVDFGIPVALIAIPFAVDGKIKAIAITGSERNKALPNVPSVGEGGVQELKALGVYAFYGVAGPAGMPASVVQTLNDAFTKIANMPDVQQKFGAMHLRPTSGTSAQFRQSMESELQRWREVGKNLKISNS